MVEQQQQLDLLQSDCIASVSVSSVLQKNTKEYGKKHLYDGKDETCWHSDQGLPQSVTLKFKEAQQLTAVGFVGQGGFCPREIVLHLDGVEV